MVLRHHNEAESLNAVQKMDWEWKVNELAPTSTASSSSSSTSGGTRNHQVQKHDPSHQIDDLHIPMVHVSDDFDLANC